MAAQVQGVRPPSSTCVLLDTSASMNQRTKDNLSLLDVAKAAIEHMVRRFQNERQHKFLLVTTRGGGTVESGWADSQTMFLQKVTIPLPWLSCLPLAVQAGCCAAQAQAPAEVLIAFRACNLVRLRTLSHGTCQTSPRHLPAALTCLSAGAAWGTSITTRRGDSPASCTMRRQCGYSRMDVTFPTRAEYSHRPEVGR